jgi:hypothetical protein
MEVSLTNVKKLGQHTAVQSNPGINTLEFCRVLSANDSTNAFVGLAECLGFSQSGDGNAVGDAASFLQKRNRRTTTLYDNVWRVSESVRTLLHMRNNESAYFLQLDHGCMRVLRRSSRAMRI